MKTRYNSNARKEEENTDHPARLPHHLPAPRRESVEGKVARGEREKEKAEKEETHHHLLLPRPQAQKKENAEEKVENLIPEENGINTVKKGVKCGKR